MDDEKMTLISVIVPVYNTAHFLKECLYSLEMQTLDAIEVIMINDGSTDDSGTILKEFADKDSRFKYIEQHNQGLSVARNTGLKRCRGTYIAFLDSDDWLGREALEVLYKMALTTNADMVAGNTLAVYPDGRFSSWNGESKGLFKTGDVMPGAVYFTSVMSEGRYVPMVCSYLYQRAFLEQHHFCFEPGLIHKDELWTPQVLLTAQRIVVSNLYFYFYRQHDGSLMTTTTAEHRIESILIIIDKLLEFVKTYLSDERQVKVRESVYMRLLQIYAIACSLYRSGMYTTLYDKAGEMIHICEKLQHQGPMGYRCKEAILNRMKLYFYENQADIYHKIN